MDERLVTPDVAGGLHRARARSGVPATLVDMDRTTVDRSDAEPDTPPAVEGPRVGFNARYTATTALVVVDVQNDFADPKGSLYVAGAETILPVINREIRRARSSQSLVVASQ